MMNSEKTIARSFEENIDGIIYVTDVYSDGYMDKHIKPGYENAITNTDQRKLDLEMNIQYLVDLAEINMEG